MYVYIPTDERIGQHSPVYIHQNQYNDDYHHPIS